MIGVGGVGMLTYGLWWGTGFTACGGGLFFFIYYSMPHYMVILHALLNLIISFTFALNNNKLYWMLFILVTSIIIF